MTGKPQPAPSAETLPYFEGGAENELRYSWCPVCQKALFPPRSVCQCGTPTEWRLSSRRGAIHSFTIVERAPLESFEADVPYAIGLIDLAEGFRIMTNVRGASPRIGAEVEIVFDALENGLFLPQAKMPD